jgi:ElaB protein
MDTTTTPTCGNGKDHVSASLRQMLDEADHLLRSAAETGDRKFDEAKLRMEHQLRELRLQLDGLQEGASYQARRAMRAADRSVSSHPYRTAGIAAAAGLLVGLLVARR